MGMQRWDGGFGNDRSFDHSTLYHTYLAVSYLDVFNRTFILNNKYLGSYFAEQFYDDGSAGDIVNTYYAVHGMLMMNVTESIWNAYTWNTEWFVKSLYVLPGGFGASMFDEHPYVYSTYFSLMTMIDLGPEILRIFTHSEEEDGDPSRIISIHVRSYEADSINVDELKPVIDRVMPLSQGRKAYEILERGGQFGKIVLTP